MPRINVSQLDVCSKMHEHRKEDRGTDFFANLLLDALAMLKINLWRVGLLDLQTNGCLYGLSSKQLEVKSQSLTFSGFQKYLSFSFRICETLWKSRRWR